MKHQKKYSNQYKKIGEYFLVNMLNDMSQENYTYQDEKKEGSQKP